MSLPDKVIIQHFSCWSCYQHCWWLTGCYPCYVQFYSSLWAWKHPNLCLARVCNISG
jgi:hypothetical protein